jgi:hypothetical protein
MTAVSSTGHPPDIHLDLDAIRAVIDPKWRKKSERLRNLHGREYGAAIAALRRDRGLRQIDIAGVSARQLRRIEDSGAVSVRTMELLARDHRITLSNYLDAVAAKLKLPVFGSASVAAD